MNCFGIRLEAAGEKRLTKGQFNRTDGNQKEKQPYAEIIQQTSQFSGRAKKRISSCDIYNVLANQVQM